MIERIKYMICAIAGVALVACSADEGHRPDASKPHSIDFVLAIDAPGTTRAEWGDTEPTDEMGTGFENRILPASLRVAVYSADNRLIGEVEQLDYWPITDDGSRYQFHGKVPATLVEDASNSTVPEYKFMVYANASEGDNASIVYTVDDINIDNGAIPMWGIKQVNISELLNNRVQQLGTISLLRAVAKIEVLVDDSLTDVAITSTTLNYHNREGYVLPTGWDNTTSTEALDRDGAFRGLRSLSTSPLALTEVEAGRKFIAYIPEYENTLFADYEAKLTVDVLNNGTAMSFPDALEFKSYVGGRPTGEVANIVRNTIYRFRITSVASGSIVLNYEVADWQRSDNWEWVQHFDYPNYHNPVLPDSATRDGDTSNDIYPDTPTMHYTAPNQRGSIATEEGAFSCWFQMVSPTGQMWLPTLRSASDRCEIRVYKEVDAITRELVYTTEESVTDESLKDGSKLVAYTGWYNILVIPTDASYTGIAHLGITYSQEWMGTGARYLLINGEADKIIWPNSGNDPRIIDIQQVTN